MVYLRKINTEFLTTGLYLIEGDDCSVERYVLSTPETTAICNDPSVVGMAYKRRLQSAVMQALSSLPGMDEISSVPEESVCIFNILRGGLNFRLDDALANAWQMNNHTSAFVSSQRRPAENAGTYEDGCIITEDSYKKLEIPEHATLLCGDVVATGTTLRHNLDVLCSHIEEKDLKPRNLLFFTIGCDNAEKIIAQADKRLRKDNSFYNRTIVVYFEGRFDVATNSLRDEFLERYSISEIDPESKIVLPGTDLIRHPALLAPEFENSQLENPAYPLERCTIYDAGSRAFRVPTHLEDVQEYWEILRRLGEKGITLNDMVNHRWPFNVRYLPQDITQAKCKWAKNYGIEPEDKRSLENLAERRIESLSGNVQHVRS